MFRLTKPAVEEQFDIRFCVGCDNRHSSLEIHKYDCDQDNVIMTLYLRRVWHQGSGDLADLLHALVLHRRDVLKPRWRHIPVQTRLAPLGRLLATITTIPGSGPSTCDTVTQTILFFFGSDGV